MPTRTNGPRSRSSTRTQTISSDAESRLVGYVRDLFFRARAHRRALVSQWVKNYNVVWNRTWGTREAWMPSPELPETFPIIGALVGWMTDQRPTFSVSPSSLPHSSFHAFYLRLAEDLQTVMQTLWNVRDLEAEVETALWDAHVYGTAIFKSSWDDTLDGGLGDAIFKRIDPFTFYPDPAARTMDSSNYFFEVRTLSMQEIDRRWPGASRKLAEYGFNENVDESPTALDETTSSIPRANPGAISPATSPRYGLPGQTDRLSVTDDPGVTVIEAWLREHHTDEDGRIIDTWRVVVVAGNCVLMDEPALNLWSHGQHPYERYVTIETGEFWGPSLVELMSSAQISINRLLAAMEQNIYLLGNPVFMEETRAGIQRTKVTNKPGQRITKNTGSQAEWLTPPQMHPQLSSDLVRFYKGELENISGLSAVTRGFTPTGRNAQGVMDSVQEAAFVRVRLALRNLERTLRRVGTKMASLVVEYYDTPRIVAIVGDDGEKSSLALKSMHFYLPSDEGRVPMKFQLLVEGGSMLPTSHQARIAEADALYAMGAIDEEAVLEIHRYPGRQRILARVREMKAAAGTLGQPPGARQRTRR